ncbi:hypothetical protein FO519_000521 [Halicephalobus sp. NKZ332]|nr:hypothetical protein FO519_000521 [Halicephalobus sp. NKZ332]
MASRPPRLNKDHGFLKCIIRNQIERDEYDKAVALTKKGRSVQVQQRHVSKLMERNIYVPPHLRDPEMFRNGSKSPGSNRSSSDEDSSDPHQNLRERARRKLVKEGVLPSHIPSSETESLASAMMDKLNVSDRVSSPANLPK